MKKFLLTVLVAAAAVLPVGFAAEAEPEFSADDLNAAYEFMEASGMPAQFDQVTKIMMAQFSDSPIYPVMLDFLKKYVSYEAIKTEVAKLYLSSFSVDEIRQLTALYRTELGKKVVAKMPELTQKAMLIGQQRVLEHQKELEEAVAKAMAEAEK